MCRKCRNGLGDLPAYTVACESKCGKWRTRPYWPWGGRANMVQAEKVSGFARVER